MKCNWCDEKFENGRVKICPKCGYPNNRWGYGAIIVKSLTLPLLLAIIATGYQYYDKKTAEELEDRRLLASAYVELGLATNRFRRAGELISLSCKAMKNDRKSKEICFNNLKAGVIELDNSLIDIGPRLVQFNEILTRKNKSNLSTNNGGKTTLIDTYLRCFIVPYFGNAGIGNEISVPRENTYSYKIENVFDTNTICANRGCIAEASVKIGSIVGDIYSGTCLDARPEEQRPMNWFNKQVQKIIFEADIANMDTPGGDKIAKPNEDLVGNKKMKQDNQP